MGRRGISPADDARWIFNRLVDAYRRRPGYPPELVTRLLALARGGPIVDLGAGLGHLALPLARAGAGVTAVEPARAMLDALAARARDEGARLACVHAAAEETGLPGGAFGLAVLADALHWVDPQRAGEEAGRLLAEDGVAAIVEPSFAPTPFMDEVAAILARANPRARRPRRDGAQEQFLALAACSGAARASETFTQAAALDDAQLEGVVRSLSYAGPALGEQALGEVVAELRRAAERHGGAVWTRDLRLETAARARPVSGETG